MNNEEKDDRRQRFQRKRSHAHVTQNNDKPRRRKEPYKRQQLDYDDYLEEELNEWEEFDNY